MKTFLVAILGLSSVAMSMKHVPDLTPKDEVRPRFCLHSVLLPNGKGLRAAVLQGWVFNGNVHTTIPEAVTNVYFANEWDEIFAKLDCEAGKPVILVGSGNEEVMWVGSIERDKGWP